ncbi:DUF3488 domain-containing protein [Pseudoalteromonas sp. MMG010]|uniref:transglutaminase family protein n=1 Tax=Pseudoalteromonas sp. MMG010 TaxID=2822685 RepID=UPI001B3A48D1|nr:DUF3488 and transglutaminase-like domain-containing protein [Pseudoalteromonas sp. MMG010]MBQ4832419.1 DUF3488 domain-containing protein [Pseudoalteromonas sp. MMG010]
MSELNNHSLINITLSSINMCLILLLLSFFSPLFIIILALLGAWNIYLSIVNNAKPKTRKLNILAAISLVVMFYSVGFKDTVNLFVAMLIMGTIFKLLQAHTKKNYQTVTTLNFFCLSAIYLFDQGIITTVIVSLLFVLNFAVLALIDSTHKFKKAFLGSIKMVLFGLPIAIFLLLFLPKLPAFWQLPSPKVAKTGLNEQINPFDIAKLSNSDELVFRAKFNKPKPSTHPLYWRALIHDQFVNNTWQTSKYSRPYQVNNIKKRLTAESDYSIIVEPNANMWLYGLNYSSSEHKNVKSTFEGTLIKRKPQSAKFQYSVSSAALNTDTLSKEQVKRYLSISNTYNSQTQALAHKLRNSVGSDAEFVSALQLYFKDQLFSYTLTPPPLTGENTIDQFMFDSKRGFCGHYASAAAFMFRTAGIPARVVSGYLGGEYNSSDNYYSIRQYDAHAWVEIYLTGTGWQIFDATSTVAPMRLNGSLSQLQQISDEFKSNLDFGLVSLSDFAVINYIRIKLENLDYKWSSWVVGFDKQKQRDFLKRLFGEKNIWLVPLFCVGVLCVIIGIYFVYLNFPVKKEKAIGIVKEYETLVKIMAKKNIISPEHYSPQQKLSYFAQQRPGNKPYFEQFNDLFVQIRYQQQAYTKQRKNQAINLINLIKNSK